MSSAPRRPLASTIQPVGAPDSVFTRWAGGRGKAGFVKLVKSPGEARDAARFMLTHRMVSPQTGPEGLDVRRLLVAAAVDIAKEYYLAITVDRGPGKTKVEKATFHRLGGMCPRCEGMGSVTDFDLTALYDESLSLNEGALTIPGYSMEGWYGRIYRGCGYFDPDKQKAMDAPGMVHPPHEKGDFRYRAGCTVLMDPTTMEVRRVIRTAGTIADDQQLNRVRKHITEGASGPSNAFQPARHAIREREPFALLHRQPES